MTRKAPLIMQSNRVRSGIIDSRLKSALRRIVLLTIAATAFPLRPCFAEEAPPAAEPLLQGFECPKIDKPYVHLPIKFGAPKVKLLVKIDGELQHAIYVKLAQGKPDWNGTFTVDQWMGRKLTIVPEQPLAESGWIRNVILSAQLSDEEANIYGEKYRPQFHFTGRRGWINDVNGPFYLNGEYHLMFQHRPWQTEETDLDDVLWRACRQQRPGSLERTGLRRASQQIGFALLRVRGGGLV